MSRCIQMNKDWFTDEAVEAFSKSLADLPVAVSDRDGDPVSNDSSDSVEVSMTPFPDDSSRNFERWTIININFVACLLRAALQSNLLNCMNDMEYVYM